MAFATCLSIASVARASGDQELDVARTRLEAGQYAEAVERFRRLLDPTADKCPEGPALTPSGCRLVEPELALAARGYLVVALVATERIAEARVEVEKVLRTSPTFSPSPTIFPQRAIDLFIEARGRLADELAEIMRKRAAEDFQKGEDRKRKDLAREKYIRDLEDLASRETVVSKGSRLIAMIPFGVGQFQNDNIGLGVTFGASQVLAGGTAIVTSAIYQNLVKRAAEHGSAPAAPTPGVPEETIDEAEFTQQLQTLQAVNIVAFGVFALSAVVGIVEAQVSFVDEVKTERKRKIPPRPAFRVTPGPRLDPGPATATTGIDAGIGFEWTF